MLRRAKDMEGFAMHATDGQVGRVADFMFAARDWRVRYVVVDTGSFLAGHPVLLSTDRLLAPSFETRLLSANLTRAQVRDLPEPESPRGDHTERLPEPEDTGGVHSFAAPEHIAGPEEERETKPDDLLSVDRVIGYDIQATDGRIGHMEDLFIDEDTWDVRYLLIDTRDWLPGRRVIIPPQWVGELDIEQGEVRVDLERQRIQDSPEYDPQQPLDRQYEIDLYDYYAGPGYWV